MLPPSCGNRRCVPRNYWLKAGKEVHDGIGLGGSDQGVCNVDGCNRGVRSLSIRKALLEACRHRHRLRILESFNPMAETLRSNPCSRAVNGKRCWPRSGAHTLPECNSSREGSKRPWPVRSHEEAGGLVDSAVQSRRNMPDEAETRGTAGSPAPRSDDGVQGTARGPEGGALGPNWR